MILPLILGLAMQVKPSNAPDPAAVARAKIEQEVAEKQIQVKRDLAERERVLAVYRKNGATKEAKRQAEATKRQDRVKKGLPPQ